MAQAFKCDRCGKYFSTEDFNYIVNDLGIILKNNSDRLDICIKCADSFVDWLKDEDKKHDDTTDV